jgi:hypothetical protein
MSHECVDKLQDIAKRFRAIPKRKNKDIALNKTVQELDSFVNTEFKPDKFNAMHNKDTTPTRLARLATKQRRVATKVLRDYRKTIDPSRFDVEAIAAVLDNTAKHLEFATRIYKGDVKQANAVKFDKQDVERMSPHVLRFVQNNA